MTPTEHPLVPGERLSGESPQIGSAPCGSPPNASQAGGVAACKRCGGKDIARHGSTASAKQRLRCRACGATFLDNLAPPRMRFSTEVIAAALELFSEGATLKEIVKGLAARGHVGPNHANIHRWIVRYSTTAVLALAELTPVVGDTWLVVGSKVESRATGGRPAWSWDVFDQSTGLLLCSHFCKNRAEGGRQQALRRAEQRAVKGPTQVRFGSWTRAVGATDRFESHLYRRRDVVASITSFRILELVIEGWRVDYNLLRPQPELRNLTPVEYAGGPGMPGSWEQVIERA